MTATDSSMQRRNPWYSKQQCASPRRHCGCRALHRRNPDPNPYSPPMPTPYPYSPSMPNRQEIR